MWRIGSSLLRQVEMVEISVAARRGLQTDHASHANWRRAVHTHGSGSSCMSTEAQPDCTTPRAAGKRPDGGGTAAGGGGLNRTLEHLMDESADCDLNK